MLFFSRKNAKIKTLKTAIFDLPAGHSCPFALICLARADKETGELRDGEFQTVRCYAASQEAAFPAVRKNRWNNYEILSWPQKSVSRMHYILTTSLPKDCLLVRVHSSGDFFSYDYFCAWMETAKSFPHVTFYAYTKAIPFWLRGIKEGIIPSNFKLNASYGGKYDALISAHKLKSVTIVNDINEAQVLGLEIDHDDSHAWNQNKSFALLIHGNGPKGSFQAKLFNVNIRAKGKEK